MPHCEPHFERILVVGAHPDDAEFHAAGLMLTQKQRGSHLGILSLTDGSAGHYESDRKTLAVRRSREAQEAARILGATIQIWNEPDGELAPTVELRKRLVKNVREFAPDLLVTHRPYDYHPDHRATAQLVQDACYLLRVPNVEPEVPPLETDPVVLSVADFFSHPVSFRADIVLPTDHVLAEVVELLACHVSQVFEWLPHMYGLSAPDTDRISWLRAFYESRPREVARRWAQGCRFAEAFELSEYGRRVEIDEIARKLGLGTAV